MNIFGKSAVEFSKDVDTALSAFKSTITKLRATAEKAELARAEKCEEIVRLENECLDLKDVSSKATNYASKLEELFK